MPQLSRSPRPHLALGSFATKTPSVAYAMVVLADGLPIAVPTGWTGR